LASIAWQPAKAMVACRPSAIFGCFGAPHDFARMVCCLVCAHGKHTRTRQSNGHFVQYGQIVAENSAAICPYCV
jgi:hypothetical protein